MVHGERNTGPGNSHPPVAAVLSDYRRLDAAERPAGSRRVHVIVDLTPWFRPDGESQAGLSPDPA